MNGHWLSKVMISAAAGLAMLAFAPGSANALIMLFDDAATQGGTVSGTSASVSGTDIIFDTISVVGAPANSGVALDCVSCRLNFSIDGGSTTGLFTNEYLGSGSFTVTGTAKNGATTIASGTLLTGTIDTAFFGLASQSFASFNGFGTDTKNQDLLDFYGIIATDFEFANTEISMNCNPANLSSFSCTVTDADLDNTTKIPEPRTLTLFGFGLLGLGLLWRRKSKALARA